MTATEPAAPDPGADAAPVVLERPRLAALSAALGAARLATMMGMLRAELAPLLAAPATAADGPMPAHRFGDAGHVHAMKGAAASLGAMAFARACAAHEAALRDGDAAATRLSEQRMALAATITCHAIDANDWAPAAA